MEAASGYAEVLGVSDAERARLIGQAVALEPDTSTFLDTIGTAPGGRMVDIGCGPLGILDLLSARAGPNGEVVGVDEVQRFVELAADIVAERGLTNVRVVRADARESGLPAGSFDLVHERLVLIGPERDPIAAAMVDLARPGGVVAGQEIDIASSFCEPASPACARLLETFLAATRRIGADPSVGRRLGVVLSQAGAIEVQIGVCAALELPGSARRQQLAAVAAHARELIVQGGLLGEEQLDWLLAKSTAHHADPATLVFGGLLFQAWGRRPTG